MKNKSVAILISALLTVAVLALAIAVVVKRQTDGKPAVTAQVTTTAATEPSSTAAAATTAAAAATAATTGATTAVTATAPTEPPKSDAPLIAATGSFTGKFSPFDTQTDGDEDVVALTQLFLLTTDRTGAPVYDAIEGETREYNGTNYTYTGPADVSVTLAANGDAIYRARLREDLVFSDGEPVTADDVIFTLYVLMDTSYTGSREAGKVNVVGLVNYRRNHAMAESVEITDAQIQALIDDPSDAFKAQIAGLVSRVLLSELEWVRTLYGNEAYASFTEAYPETKDLFYAFYGTDSGYDSTQEKSEQAVVDKVLDEYGVDWRALGVNYQGSPDYFRDEIRGMARENLFQNAIVGMESRAVLSIEGITRADDYTVEIRTHGYDAGDLERLLNIPIAPLHHYGDPAKYDYEKNRFGFTRGDIGAVLEADAAPLGAGPYRFAAYEGDTVRLLASETWYRGEPVTRELRLRSLPASAVLPGIAEGTVDAGVAEGAKVSYASARAYNAGGELDGDVLTVARADDSRIEYIGLNAEVMSVDGDPGSQASKFLRRAFATVLAVFREAAVEEYYGDAAVVLDYPLSRQSWASPQPGGEGYRAAFSTYADGNPIYAEGADADERVRSAVSAAKDFLEAAGFQYDSDSGLFTEAPEGASLSYDAVLSGDAAGSAACRMLLTNAAAALETIGIELTVSELPYFNELQSSLAAGTCAIWCDSRPVTAEPALYGTYHSSGIPGAGGSETNWSRIADDALDTLLAEARASDDPGHRRTVLREAMDVIAEWAVEVPFCQRQNLVAFSTARVKTDTVTPDITAFWGWMREIELLEMQ